MRSLLFVSLSLIAACAPDSKDETKGQVDESGPPSIPTEAGKADGASKLVAVDVQSPHPYANNVDRTFAVSLAALPSCAQHARLHFKVLRTEARYDFVSVEPGGGEPVQSFDGNKDNTWTEWFAIGGSSVTVRLDTDGSITRHGFEIDQIEWDGTAEGCPLVRFPPCGAGTVDLAKVPGTCECPVAPQCADLTAIEVTHAIARGRNHTINHVGLDLVAENTYPGPTDALVTKVLGTVDGERLGELVRRTAERGLLHSGGYARDLGVTDFHETITIKAGAYEVSWIAPPEGGHDAEIVALAAEIDALFECGATKPLTCGAGFECSDDATCHEVASCFCPANYDPVCGEDGRTYSNGCTAGCAHAPVAHVGECGITGDACGTIMSFGCQDGFKCRYDASTWTAPFPDAGGGCVARTYCDAPADCTELPHPAVPGTWQCATNTCSWQAGLAWKAVANGRFESAHPYANGTSVWKELALPAGAQALRLTAASFKIERDYDFVEVWTWQNAAWKLVKRYTGTVGPSPAQEFPGRYHYLRFVSDSSVTDTGFVITAEYR